jgi:hypothetical protein
MYCGVLAKKEVLDGGAPPAGAVEGPALSFFPAPVGLGLGFGFFLDEADSSSSRDDSVAGEADEGIGGIRATSKYGAGI